MSYVEELEIEAYRNPVLMMNYNERGSLLATLSCDVTLRIIHRLRLLGYFQSQKE